MTRKSIKSNDQESKYIYNNPSHVRFTNHSNRTKNATWKQTQQGHMTVIASLPNVGPLHGCPTCHCSNITVPLKGLQRGAKSKATHNSEVLGSGAPGKVPQQSIQQILLRRDDVDLQSRVGACRRRRPAQKPLSKSVKSLASLAFPAVLLPSARSKPALALNLLGLVHIFSFG